MTQPTWITPAGTLGTIPEGRFYQLPLRAISPVPGEDAKFRLISGRLPAGIQVRIDGTLEGIPEAVAITQGVPLPVSENVTSKFAIRAYIEIDDVIVGVADRTFTLTVAGQDTPEFETPAGLLGVFLDATEVSIQIEYSDPDPDDDIVISIAGGSLPPGLTLSRSGLISGIIVPQTGSAGLLNTEYNFTLSITDGKDSNLRQYSIYVYSRDNIPPSSPEEQEWFDQLYNDSSDLNVERPPFILTTEGSLGTYRHDNFFAFKFDAIDFNSDVLEFAIVDVTDLPPADDSTGYLRLDPVTGWLSGYIPALGTLEESYTFDIRVFKKYKPWVSSRQYTFSINIIGNIETEVTWHSPEDLGTLYSGEPSTVGVVASTTLNKELLYRLQQGSNSRLPQGLRLYPDGSIVGRPSFNTLRFDNGFTTFDSEHETRLDATPTTFETVYWFTVEAHNEANKISVFKRFSVRLLHYVETEPWETVYIQAMPPLADREKVKSIVTDDEAIPPELVYRPNDPKFGTSSRVTYPHLYGTGVREIALHYEAVTRSHYRKKVVLGPIETAIALDDAGDVIYEVVFSRVIDDIPRISEMVRLMSNMQNRPEVDGEPVVFVYPNSLNNMRTRVFDVVGQVHPALPKWMKSKQPDGRILGFTPAWVIAYTVPGASRRVAYAIRERYGSVLNEIDFDIDRYIVDKEVTGNWDPVEQSWGDIEITTFDREHGFIRVADGSTSLFETYIVSPTEAGLYEEYVVSIDGVEVQSTLEDSSGVYEYMLNPRPSESCPPGDSTVCGYWDVAFVTPPPSGAVITIMIRDAFPRVETIFDGGSIRFVSPVDLYDRGTQDDKYVVFPKRGILR